MENHDPMGKFNKVEEGNPLIDMLQLLVSGEDLAFKTRIKNPRAYAILKTLSETCFDIGFKNTGETIARFIDYEHTFLVSKDGQSRAEFVDAFKSVNDTMQQQLSMSDKLTKNLKEEL